ncbi:unnamed protein product [Ixodes pacificus]
MVRYCSVPQCRTYAFEPGPVCSLHHYPRDKKLRARWVSKLKMGKKLTAHAMVCSRHFSADAFKVKRAGVKGTYWKNRYLKPSSVPSENLPKGSHDRVSKTRKPAKGDRENPSLDEYSPSTLSQVDHESCNGARLRAEHVNVQEDCEYANSEATLSCGDDSEATVSCGDDSEATLTCEDDSEAALTCDDQNEATMSSEEWSEAAESCEELSDSDYNAEWTEKSLLTTGSPFQVDSCVQVDTLLKQKQGHRISLSMVKSDKELVILSGVGSLQLMKNIVTEFDNVRKQMTLKARFLCSGDPVLMVMVKLYHNVSISFLAFLFGVHRTAASENLKTAICILSHVLGAAVFIPSDDSIEENLTVYFRKFPHTKIILDCTEIAI